MLYIWLGVGVFFILLEAIAFPGIGFFFAGLGAVTTGGLITFHVIEENNLLLQTVSFLLTTVVWTLLLWVPFKRYRYKTSQAPYQNIVGSHAVVIETPLQKHGNGVISWSGTRMVARLDAGQEVSVGEEVEITRVEGNVVYVKPIIRVE